MAHRGGPALRLLEPPPDDPATSLRREIKFELPRTDPGKLHDVLRLNHHSVAHAGPVSVVHSVYFDDPCLGSCAESIAGTGWRSKLRLRWYDSPLPQQLAFLEVKRRRYELIDKQRYPVGAEAGFGGMGYRELVAELIRLLPGAARELLRTRPSPVVLIRYRRRHYRDRRPGSPVRLTVDDRITAFDQIGALAPRTRFGTRLRDRVVLEVKYPPSCRVSLPGLLYPLRPRRTRCSKYLLACRQIGDWTGAVATAYS